MHTVWHWSQNVSTFAFVQQCDVNVQQGQRPTMHTVWHWSQNVSTFAFVQQCDVNLTCNKDTTDDGLALIPECLNPCFLDPGRLAHPIINIFAAWCACVCVCVGGGGYLLTKPSCRPLTTDCDTPWPSLTLSLSTGP